MVSLSEFASGFFVVLGVKEVFKDRKSSCKQIDPHIKPSHAMYCHYVHFFGGLGWYATRLHPSAASSTV